MLLQSETAQTSGQLPEAAELLTRALEQGYKRALFINRSNSEALVSSTNHGASRVALVQSLAGPRGQGPGRQQQQRAQGTRRGQAWKLVGSSSDPLLTSLSSVGASQVGSADAHASLARLAASQGDQAAAQQHWASSLQAYTAALSCPAKVGSPEGIADPRCLNPFLPSPSVRGCCVPLPLSHGPRPSTPAARKLLGPL